MRRIFTIALVLLTLTVSAQVLRNKKYDMATAGSSITIPLASDAQLYFVYGTKTLSSGYSVGVSGSAVDGKTILLFYNGTSLTTSGNTVTLFGTALSDKQATSKLIVVAIYKTSAWEVRIANDAMTTNWIKIADLDTSVMDNQTVELNVTNGIQVKAGGINNTQIGASAAIAASKLSLSHAIDSSMISYTANIPYNRMVPLTANRVPYIDASGYPVASSTTATELGYLAGVTSAVQTQINAKATSGSIVNADINASAAIAYSKLSLAGTILNADIASACSLAWAKMYPLTASKVPYINSSGVMAASTVTDTELGYLSGVTSSVQTQLTAARASRTYTKTSSTPLVLNSSATDSYLITVTTTPIVVTLPAAADFPQYHTIEFTRLGSVSDSSITIIAASGDAIEGVGGTDVANYILPSVQAGGAGVAFITNGTDSWAYIRRW